MKIEYRRDEGLTSFVFAGGEYVISADGAVDVLTFFEVVYGFVAGASSMELFSGPSNKSWTMVDLSEFVFNDRGEDRLRDVAILLTGVLVSLATITDSDIRKDGVLKKSKVKELRPKWLNLCINCAKDGAGEDWTAIQVARLLTACQFFFNEFVTIGEEVYRFGSPRSNIFPDILNLC